MAEDEKKDNDHGKVLAEWEFSEFTKYERGKAWYFWMILLVVLIMVYSVITVNFLLAVIVIIGAITLTLIHQREPAQISIKITEDGLETSDRFFPFSEIKNFYLIYQPPVVKSLFFEFKSLTKPRLNVPLVEQNPVSVRETLLKYLSEDLAKESEPLSESLSRFLKL